MMRGLGKERSPRNENRRCNEIYICIELRGRKCSQVHGSACSPFSAVLCAHSVSGASGIVSRIKIFFVWWVLDKKNNVTSPITVLVSYWKPSSFFFFLLLSSFFCQHGLTTFWRLGRGFLVSSCFFFILLLSSSFFFFVSSFTWEMVWTESFFRASFFVSRNTIPDAPVTRQHIVKNEWRIYV